MILGPELNSFYINEDDLVDDSELNNFINHMKLNTTYLLLVSINLTYINSSISNI